MSYIYLKELVSFDATTSQLTVSVTTVWEPGNTLVDTQTLIVTLPVDEFGRVPTDASVLDAIIEDRIRVRLPDVKTLIPPGGIVNASDVYYLTTDVEAGTLPVGSFYVLLTPNELTRDNMAGTVTQWIMTVITSRTDETHPTEFGQLVGLDNGNIVASAGLSEVESPGVTDPQLGPYDIIAANDNTGTLTPWAAVYDNYPGFLDNLTTTYEQGFIGYQYVIETAPLKAFNYATAIFSY